MNQSDFFNACSKGDIDLAEQLISHVDINKKGILSQTPLINAARYGHKYIVELLINNGADLNLQRIDGNTALMLAISSGYRKIAFLLIDSKANLEIKNNDGFTALIVAAIFSEHEVIKHLLKNGATPNAQDNKGFTAIYYRFDAASLLIEYQIDLNLQSNSGNTALMYGAYKGCYIKSAELLLSCNIEIENKSGWTALMIAEKYHRRDIAELLLKVGANINHQDINGDTLLIRSGQEDILFLHKNGADFFIENNARDSGYSLLIERKNNSGFLNSLLEKVYLERYVSDEQGNYRGL